MPVPRILFLCTGNSCRSQMAEGWANHLHAGRLEAFSAGVFPSEVHPLAIRVMAEEGVDISSHRSKHADEFAGADLDLVITLCDHARQTCPHFPGGVRMMHVPFEDPVPRANDPRSDEEILADYRRVRDEIRRFVEKLPGLV